MSEIESDKTLKDSVIVGASGDHRVRDLKMDSDRKMMVDFGVPFYLYVPKKYQKNIHYDKNRVGSHKDIMPTLYELSLSGAKHINVGGKNMLSKTRNSVYEFGINHNNLWMDDKLICPIYSGMEFCYEWETEDSVYSSGEKIPMNQELRDRIIKYGELLKWQINYRVMN